VSNQRAANGGVMTGVKKAKANNLNQLPLACFTPALPIGHDVTHCHLQIRRQL
jgi:hypothetical protein